MSAPAVGIMRVTNHPRNTEWLLLKFGPELNKLIGTFGPAQQALDLGGYVMHKDQLDPLKTWANYQAVTLFVEARSIGEPTRPVECGNTLDDGTRCAAPYKAGAIPKFCATCGQPANPVIFDAGEPVVGTKCEACGRIIHGGPAFCIHCGAAMQKRRLSAPTIPRTKSEPISLAESIAATPELALPSRAAVAELNIEEEGK